MVTNPADQLMDAMDAHAPPQRIESILREVVEEVVEREIEPGWFDLVGIIGGVAFLVIRYQWWPTGWHYRIINPNN